MATCTPSAARGFVSVACAFVLLVGATGCRPAVRDAPLDPIRAGRTLRVLCLGDSLTACDTCWPSHLAAMLGPGWIVENLGEGGATIHHTSDKPYWELMANRVVDRRPDVVLVLLGTNDSKPRHWYHRDEVARDFDALLEALERQPSHPLIWVCLPPPVFPGQWGIDESRLRDIRSLLRAKARSHRLPVIDLHEPLLARAEYFPDQVHPDERASALIAATIRERIAGPNRSP